jgi:aspartyl-tRNA(Asn)/glutamyl-tRNA(Gln) amidotransferase subunit C
MLDKEQVEHLAKLAKLEVTEEEKDKYTKQLSAVLVYFKHLNEVDTEKIEATDHITGLQDVTRPDEVHEAYSSEQVLAAVPEVEKRQVKVKAVFDNKGSV